MPDSGSERPSGRRPDAGAKSMADVLMLPDPLRALVNWMVRQGEVTLAEIAAQTGQDDGAASAQLESLLAQGFIEEVADGGARRYRTRLIVKRAPRTLDILKVLEEEG
jgi:DNA-binding transcriptional ArsR family regulator